MGLSGMLREIYLVCILSLTFNEVGTFFKVAVTVARGSRAPVLPAPEECVNGPLGVCGGSALS